MLPSQYWSIQWPWSLSSWQAFLSFGTSSFDQPITDTTCTLKYRIVVNEEKEGRESWKYHMFVQGPSFTFCVILAKQQKQEYACARSLSHWTLTFGPFFLWVEREKELFKIEKRGRRKRQRDVKEMKGKRKKERKEEEGKESGKNNRKNVVYMLTWHRLWKSPQGSPCAFPRRSSSGGWRSTR